ncbi:MAG: flagellar basal-body rod protein FlgF [Chloroflexota bacterium]|jgi:flagellar basal-body rod protein FlgG|nr:flagellar basal-body rod protein FlgF [Chloroflexota bacterium]
MILGHYAAVSGMLTAVRRMEVVINNLANVGTPGFKQERTTSVSFEQRMMAEQASQQQTLGQMVLTTAPQAPELDLAQGPIQQTDRNLDVALEGPGLLVVQTPHGVAYTRGGSLGRDVDGYLATSDGARVLGQNGPIQVPDARVAIDADGTVISNGRPVDQLRLVEFAEDQALKRAGNGELTPTDTAASPHAATQTRVAQGAIEGSNADLTGAITSMLELQRAYDANQRMIKYQDDMATHAVNDVARPVG